MLKTVIHLSDVHIGHADRTDEYRSVFTALGDSLRVYDTLSTCVVITGDVFHNKTKYSSDDIILFGHLMSVLARFYVVIIPGNHDTNLNNKDQVDLISPLVAQYKNVKHSRNTETFKVLDRTFYHYSVYGGEFNANLLSGAVLLYHGCADGLYGNTNQIVTRDALQQAHIAMLGDIHEHQFVLPNAAYPGSLIQQNLGEVPPKGYIVWNITARSGHFVEVPNQYGFVRINVVNGNIVNFPTKFPKNIRSLCINSREPVPDSVRDEIERRCGRKIDKIAKPMMQFNQHGVEAAMREHGVYDLYKEIAKSNVASQVEWYITYMKWDNFYAYGSGNNIDFMQLGKLTGIIAPNMSGKSSIIDLIIFGLYGEPVRGTKQTLINKDERSATLYIEFIVNVAKYSIDIGFSKGKYTKVLLMRDGTNISGQTVPETYTRLAGIIGTYNEILASAVCLQDDEYNIIRMTKAKRRDILSKLFGLSGIDDMLHAIKQHAADIKKDIAAVVVPRVEDPLADAAALEDEIAALEQQLVGVARGKRAAAVVNAELANIPEFTQANEAELAALVHEGAPLRAVGAPANKTYMAMDLVKLQAFYDKNLPIYNRLAKQLNSLARIDTSRLREQAEKAKNVKFDTKCTCCQYNKHRIGLTGDPIAEYNKAVEHNKAVDAEEAALREQLDKHDLDAVYDTIRYKLWKNRCRAEELLAIKGQQQRRAELIAELQDAVDIDTRAVSERIGTLRARVAGLNAEAKIKEHYDTIMPILTDKLEKYKKLKSLIGEKGMQVNMLHEYMKSIIEQCNKIIGDIAGFGISITPELEFMLDNGLPLDMGSGFQKFITSIVFRLVLTQVLPAAARFLIIDEGFGCMDEKNIAKMPRFLEAVMNVTNLQYIIIVSHIAELNESVDAKLVIKQEAGRAYLSNSSRVLSGASGSGSGGAASVAVAPKKARTVSKKVMTVVDEAVDAGDKVPSDSYKCECGKILKRASKAAHEHTAYHIAKMNK